MQSLKDKVLFITGSTRGIGKAIAIRAAKDGAKIAIIGKTESPHPKLPGTIYDAAEEVQQSGGKAIAICADIRDENQIQAAVDKTVKTFGGIDILINNASAISLTPSEITPMKKFDLMFNVNCRGTYATSVTCLPFLKKSDNPHILTLSPPISLKPHWFANHTAYTISKYGMSMCVLGMAEEFKKYKISVNALWPKTIIATAALQAISEHFPIQQTRKPDIVADAAYAIITEKSTFRTGQFLIDEDILKEKGIHDLQTYAVNPKEELLTDLFLEDPSEDLKQSLKSNLSKAMY